MRRFEDVVLGPGGIPMTGTSVAVRRRDNGVPVPGNAGLAQLYSDNGSTTKSNPTFTDELGRFSFYVSDGRYDLEITGPSIQSYTVADVLISESGGGSGGSGSGSMSDQNADSVNITGGQIKGVTINGLQPGTMLGQNADSVAITGGSIADVTLSSANVTITGGTINGQPITLFPGAGGGGSGTMSSQNADNVNITGGTIQNVVLDDNVVVKLLENATAVGAGAAQRVIASQNRTFQATLTGTGTGPLGAEVVIDVSMDQIGWLSLATVTLNGSAPGPISEGFTAWAPWSYVRARIVAIGGAGATVNVNMGEGGAGGSLTVMGLTRNNWAKTEAVGNVGAGEDDLMSVVIPANAMNVNGSGVRITAWGKKANNANAKTLKLYFGSAAILTHALTTGAAGNWRAVGLVFRTGLNAQDAAAFLDGNDSDSEIATTTQTETAAITVKCTGTGVADNDIVQEGLLIEVLR